MKPVEKALLLRKGLGLRTNDPLPVFERRIKIYRKVLNVVEESSTTQTVKREACRQYIVSLCGAFESYWRDRVKIAVDKVEKIPERSQHLNRINFSFVDISQIVGKKLTLGELVSSAYMFQSPATVNQAISDIFRVDAFAEFAKTKFVTVKEKELRALVEELEHLRALVEEKEQIRALVEEKEIRQEHDEKKIHYLASFTGSLALKEIPLIDECFLIRHDTVHNSGSASRLLKKRIPKYEHAMWFFSMLFGLYVDGRIQDRKSAAS